jgi:primosomal protein N' (replication factor Y)
MDIAPPLVARVVPDVTGLDKHFDYVVPPALAGRVGLGTLVRVPLHGRRVGGWVTALGVTTDVAIDRLKPIAKVTGHGPSVELLELASWAAVRWAAHRLRPLLVAASPPAAVTTLPAAQRTGRVVEPRHPDACRLLDAGGGVLRLPPTADPMPVVLAAAALGPTIVVEPSLDRGRLLAGAVRRAGLSVAVLPGEWDRAAGGVDVVIGARHAVWARCPGIAAIVVLDEHDETLQEERAPTWHARDVAIERARRAGAAVVLVSPAPSASAVHWAGPRFAKPSRVDERDGWPIVEIVDRTREEPWKRSLVSSPLITALRDPTRRVVCVINTMGRARLLACRSCRTIARCERCDAAVGLDDDGALRCRRCEQRRPVVCLSCGASAMANIRPGVTRLREELEAAAGRDVVAVTAVQHGPLPEAGVYVGTEAVLHRLRRADVVAFLDLDAELLAPRYRAAEQAMALLALGARVAGPRTAGGRLLVQTFLPRHEVLQAVLLADPGRLVATELARRLALGFPPAAALAAVSGDGSDELASVLTMDPRVEVAGPVDGGTYLVRASEWLVLGAALNDAPRPAGARVRVEVDPPRR